MVGLIACWTVAFTQAKEISIEINFGRFSAKHVSVPAGYSLRLVNRDSAIYTVESPGAFIGDVEIEAHSEQVVRLQRGGEFVAMIEERPDSEIALSIEPDLAHLPPVEPPFDVAKRLGLQPLDSTDRGEPGYGAVTQFDLRVKGMAARQKVLLDLYKIQEELSVETPPDELALYFSGAQWAALRGSVAMVVGLGPSAFQVSRFGQAVAAAKPRGLHPVPHPGYLGLSTMDHGQRDVLVRVTSDSYWFNLRVCRMIWHRLGGRIGNQKLEAGYSNPNGRSPILGGFYDGTGNPSGQARHQAVFQADDTAYLALYRIRFDEDKFASYSLSQRETIVGRERQTGRPQKSADIWAHKVRASDGKTSMVRMPLVFDDGVTREGVSETGLLFLAAANSLGAIETILNRMVAGHEGYRDRLLELMHFEEAAYYVVPPSPKGRYPGSLNQGPPVKPFPSPSRPLISGR